MARSGGERYSKLFSSLFRSRETRSLSHEAFRVYVGSFAHDSCRLTGLYEIDLDSLLHWASVIPYTEGSHRVYTELVPRFLDYCDAHSLLLVRGRAKRELTGSPNILAGMRREIACLPKCRLVAWFAERHGSDVGIVPPKWDETVCIPYGNPLDTLPISPPQTTSPHLTPHAPPAARTAGTTVPAAVEQSDKPVHPQPPTGSPRDPNHAPRKGARARKNAGQGQKEGGTHGRPLPGEKNCLIREFLDQATAVARTQGVPVVLRPGKDARLTAGMLDTLSGIGLELTDLVRLWSTFLALPKGDPVVSWITGGKTVGTFHACLPSLLERDKSGRRKELYDEYGWLRWCPHVNGEPDPGCALCRERQATAQTSTGEART